MLLRNLVNIIGKKSFYAENDSTCHLTSLQSDSLLTSYFEAGYDKFEFLRLKSPLPPNSSPDSSSSPPIFDTHVDAVGVGVKDIIIKLPRDDVRRKASLGLLYSDFTTHHLTRLPVQGALFKPAN